MEATRVLLEVEADVKEKFKAAQKNRAGIAVEDKYQGPALTDKIYLKEAKDQLRKAITTMVGLDEAMTRCREIEGFEDQESHRILLE